MGNYQGIPQFKSFGKFYFATDNIILYVKDTSERISSQWIGWQNLTFSGKIIKVTVQLKFPIPKLNLTEEFGIKVCGVMHNRFLADCKMNEWCFGAIIQRCSATGYNVYFHILLMFDGMQHTIEVEIYKLKLEILTCNNLLTNSSPCS